MYWYMHWCVELEKNNLKKRISNAQTSLLFHMHAHTHTHTHRVNIDVHILMSLQFEIDDDFSNVKVRMATNDARCSVVVEHLAPGHTLTTGVVPLSLGYDERGRVV